MKKKFTSYRMNDESKPEFNEFICVDCGDEVYIIEYEILRDENGIFVYMTGFCEKHFIETNDRYELYELKVIGPKNDEELQTALTEFEISSIMKS